MVKRVQLSHPQFYAFSEWMKQNKEELFASPTTYKGIALKAQEALGFAISDYSIKGALEITGLVENFLAANGKAVSLEEKNCRLLAQQVKTICVSLGIAMLPGLEELAK